MLYKNTDSEQGVNMNVIENCAQLYVPSGLFVLAAYITLFMPPTGLVARSGVPVRLHTLTKSHFVIVMAVPR